ncbi:MAG: hypothetical protein JSW39_08855, partial [Desulfobacterales bacterium]
QPRLNWDKINQRLIPRRGSQQVAVMNGGTIPDRGYYGVYLENSNLKLGEVEEEFVFESRVGEAFFLGNSEWLIKTISQDRIIVGPIAAIKAKAPFWKGDIRYRDYSTSQKIGRFRRELSEHIDQGRAPKWLMDTGLVDENTATNLVAYFERQREHGQFLPTGTQLVAEWSVDSGGEPIFILHAPLGARVNGAWAVALAAAMEKHYHTRIQYSFDDDGVLIRLMETKAPPAMAPLFQLSPGEVEELLIQALPQSPVFAVHFRYNAARALLLPRSQPRRRIPLWQQRLRAADLLQAVRQYQDFPVIIETLRECLQDVFDLPSLKAVIAGLQRRRIRLHWIETPFPSPMAAGIWFKFVASNLYEPDQIRLPVQADNFHSDLWANIANQEKIPTLLTRGLIAKAERRWQHLETGFKAAGVEELFSLIEKLGPIAEAELHRRCQGDPSAWLSELQVTHRIVAARGAQKGSSSPLWAVDPALPASQASNQLVRIERYLQMRGPVTLTAMGEDLHLPPEALAPSLEHLQRQKKIVSGRLTVGVAEEQCCDRHNFMQLYRMAIANRRTVRTPADRVTFNCFLLQWHRIAQPGQSLRELMERYRGLRFPIRFLEREVLSTRFLNPDHPALNAKFAALESLIADGEVIVQAGRAQDGGRRFVEFRRRGDGHLLADPNTLLAAVPNSSVPGRTVFSFLQENGASYLRDIEMGTGLSHLDVQQALQELAELSLVSCENYASFLLVLQSPLKGFSDLPVRVENYPTGGQARRHPRPGRSAIRQAVQERFRLRDSRWFLTTSFAVMGHRLNKSERAVRQARLLLQRHGILVKEWFRREQGLLPWHPIFRELKRLEWQGEIRRGYFVAGLSGVQFALPEAVELLENLHRSPSSADHGPILLSTLDPALPYGGMVDWGLTDAEGNPLKVARSPSNHLALVDGHPALYGENFFSRLFIPADLPGETLISIAELVKNWLKLPSQLKPKDRLVIQQINGQAAVASQYTRHLIQAGFEKDVDVLVLWPSVA